MTWIWQVRMLERAMSAVFLCAQIGLLCTLAVGMLNFLAEVVEVVTRKTR